MSAALAKSIDEDVRRPRVGIVGIGLHLPQDVRDNSWWPAEVTVRWRERAVAMPRIDTDAMSDDERQVVTALERHHGDPFQGARRRHVVGKEQSALDIELVAAREAIANAGIATTDVGMLLTHSGVPDYLCTNTACSLHERLGLRGDCFSLAVEAASNAFLMQAAIAEQAIRSGAVRYALLVQSSTFSKILPSELEHSTWMGDGATAVVVGPVAADHGFLAWEHRTDGSIENTFVAGIPGKRWYDEGRAIAYPANPPAARRMFLSLVTFAKEVCGAALAKASMTPADIAFYASHQGTSWFRAVTQSALQLTRAKFVDTFAETASIYSSNIPLSLYVARREGLLTSGDNVLMFSGGGGSTYTCGIMKWTE
jgi:3-oxoacyl-[acyl-carrier-protein] synthase III